MQPARPKTQTKGTPTSRPPRSYRCKPTGSRQCSQRTKRTGATRLDRASEEVEEHAEDKGGTKDAGRAMHTPRSCATYAASPTIWLENAEVPEEDAEAHGETDRTTTVDEQETGGPQEEGQIGGTTL